MLPFPLLPPPSPLHVLPKSRAGVYPYVWDRLDPCCRYSVKFETSPGAPPTKVEQQIFAASSELLTFLNLILVCLSLSSRRSSAGSCERERRKTAGMKGKPSERNLVCPQHVCVMGGVQVLICVCVVGMLQTF